MIDSNVCLRAVSGSSDGGGLGFGMHGVGNTGGSVTISNNYVRDWGGTSFNLLHGIYLDDSMSNATVTGNIIGPPTVGLGVTTPTGSSDIVTAMIVHDGVSNSFTNNIIDLGPAFDESIAMYFFDSNAYTGNMTGNVFEKNIVLGKYPSNSTPHPWCAVYDEEAGACSTAGVSASWFTISGNYYWNNSTGTMLTTGTVKSDASPQSVNPGCSGGALYTLSSPPSGWTPTSRLSRRRPGSSGAATASPPRR